MTKAQKQVKSQESRAARDLGRSAWKNGIMCAPCIDPDLMAMLHNEFGTNKHILKAWIDGWAINNLKEPV